LVVGHYV